MTMMLEEIGSKIREGNCEEASSALASIPETGENRATLLFLKGFLKAQEHDRAGALECYEQALEVDADHVEANFHAALIHDLQGNEDRAIDLYTQVTEGEECHVHAMLNLSILLEEAGAFDSAADLAYSVLDRHPNHVRAKYICRSIESSETMIFDERSQREREARDAILDVPVSDFELSVRSRNCLKQMNIGTLGDLLRTTEEELLAYKNFGETSLNEIKAMLSQKSLSLGQGREETAAPSAVVPGPAPTGEDAAILNRPVSELELSVRSRKCLQRLGIAAIGELTIKSEAELMTIKNFGMTSLSEIKRQLNKMGLSLRGGSIGDPPGDPQLPSIPSELGP